MRISDLRCNSTRLSLSTVESNEKCNQSSSAAKNVLADLNCLNAGKSNEKNKTVLVANESTDDEDDDDRDKKKEISSLNPASFKNRLSTIFHRFAGSKSPKEFSPSSTPIRRNQTLEKLTNFFQCRTSRQINFDDVRNELLTLTRFREGCDEDNNQDKKGLDKSHSKNL